MAPSSFRWVIGAVKDQTSISIAKVISSTTVADLDVAIVKATKHEEYPSEEKYIREILSLTGHSRVFVNACVSTLSRRLNKTRNWVVALKTLILIQRLLSEGAAAYQSEIFFATRRGTRMLNLSDFRDKSDPNSWDYSSFVRTYALYLDDRLEFRMQIKRDKHSTFDTEEQKECKEKDKNTATPVKELKIQKIFSRTQHLQHILERFLACRPTGVAKTHRIVIVALYPIVKESFQLYNDITETLEIMLDRFTNLEVSDCVKVYDIFCRVGKQFDELDTFYSWSKSIGIARTSEYPDVEKITLEKLDILDKHIKEKIDTDSRPVVKTVSTDVKYEVQVVEEVGKEGMNSIKALPPPEGFSEEPFKAEQEEEPGLKEEKAKENELGDLLNLHDDVPSCEEHADDLALALFDRTATESACASTNPWNCLADASDWETALVESASQLTSQTQRASLGGGFDMLLLYGLYQHGETTRATAEPGYGTTGSLSSVALESVGRPSMLALPAPPTAGTSNSGNTDPFASSLAVAPPSYVQMVELERKQRMLMEEQLMWQQYMREGMQGQVSASWPQNNLYMAGFPQIYADYR